MAGIVTLKERKAAEAERRTRAVVDLRDALAGLCAADSHVDILVDFPRAALDDAWNFAERACWHRKLDPEITPFPRCRQEFLARVAPRPAGAGMSDARWQDIQSDVASSVEHFSSAIRIYREPGLHADAPDGYMRRMAFMHAMYAGYTTMERALLRI